MPVRVINIPFFRKTLYDIVTDMFTSGKNSNENVLTLNISQVCSASIASLYCCLLHLISFTNNDMAELLFGESQSHF